MSAFSCFKQLTLENKRNCVNVFGAVCVPSDPSTITTRLSVYGQRSSAGIGHFVVRWSASWNRLWSARCRDVGGDLRSSDAAIVRPWAMAWAALSGSMLVQCLSPSCAHCQMTRVATSCRCCVVAVAVAERSLAFQFSLPMHADRDRRWTRRPLSMWHRRGT